MDYYDIVMDSCSFPSGFEHELGFKRVFVSGRDFEPANADKGEDAKGRLAIGHSSKNLLHAARRFAVAVVPMNLGLDRAFIETLRENSTILIIPLSMTYGASSDFALSTNMHLASKMLAYANKRKVRVGFATMARSFEHMESYMQLIELAKLIGASEDEARQGISLAGDLFGK
ncbi:MAG: hypothetical protein M1360_01950 [Candidatus Marsarchaeota archaeon]|jgi:hypothetical protein|nr:hypothetical protein [Candidatus Marsarchaeota archaeon]MCL5418684.1 hypothetical protein [Candidatus Marsarchaeota archaeon]